MRWNQIEKSWNEQLKARGKLRKVRRSLRRITKDSEKKGRKEEIVLPNINKKSDAESEDEVFDNPGVVPENPKPVNESLENVDWNWFRFM